MTIFTIGHSNLPMEKFLALLTGSGINILADIRSVPFSRFYPWFNRNALERSLKEKGISYVFDGDRLGGRIQDPDCFLAGTLPDRKVNVAELVDYSVLIKRAWFREGIENLLTLSKEKNLVLLCSEEDPLRCHRNLLAGRALAEAGIEVVHLRSKSPGRAVQPELF